MQVVLQEQFSRGEAILSNSSTGSKIAPTLFSSTPGAIFEGESLLSISAGAIFSDGVGWEGG